MWYNTIVNRTRHRDVTPGGRPYKPHDGHVQTLTGRARSTYGQSLDWKPRRRTTPNPKRPSGRPKKAWKKFLTNRRFGDIIKTVQSQSGWGRKLNSATTMALWPGTGSPHRWIALYGLPLVTGRAVGTKPDIVYPWTLKTAHVSAQDANSDSFAELLICSVEFAKVDRSNTAARRAGSSDRERPL